MRNIVCNLHAIIAWLICELEKIIKSTRLFFQHRVHKKERKHTQELWPQAKQLELTQGRRWRCPNDFFNDEMIAEVLSSQAEVIRGKTLG